MPGVARSVPLLSLWKYATHSKSHPPAIADIELCRRIGVAVFELCESPAAGRRIIMARLAWVYTASEENDKVVGRQQSFVAGPPSQHTVTFDS